VTKLIVTFFHFFNFLVTLLFGRHFRFHFG